MLARTKEVERANAPGRTKEADGQMRMYAAAFNGVLNRSLPSVPAQNAPARPSLPIYEAANFQRCMAKEMRAPEIGKEGSGDDAVELQELLSLTHRNEARDSEHCVALPLHDILQGPGHVAWKLIQNLKNNATSPLEFNDE